MSFQYLIIFTRTFHIEFNILIWSFSVDSTNFVYSSNVTLMCEHSKKADVNMVEDDDEAVNDYQIHSEIFCYFISR